MKRGTLALILALLLVSVLVPAANAQATPITPCPAGFEPHDAMEHDMEDHEGHHIGVKADANGDGQICVMVLKNGLHVHADNYIE